MNDNLKMVTEFHLLFNHPIGYGSTCEEPRNIRQLRLKLLFEELVELAEASDVRDTMNELCSAYFDNHEGVIDGDNVDKVEELDALCDLQYVLSGKILTAGLHEVFDENFQIVHENNMKKAHTSYDHAKETVLVKGEDALLNYTVAQQKGGKWLLFNKDGKLTKPHDHVKVKLKLK